MSEIKPGEALGRIGRYIVDLEADRDRASEACASVQRERDALIGELAEISAAIGTLEFMDPPDGGSVGLSEQIRRMKAALDTARHMLGGDAKVAVRECPLSPLPSGKHQVDTSMESGLNNCFFCEKPMPKQVPVILSHYEGEVK